jgi:hypothetical protein
MVTTVIVLANFFTVNSFTHNVAGGMLAVFLGVAQLALALDEPPEDVDNVRWFGIGMGFATVLSIVGIMFKAV